MTPKIILDAHLDLAFQHLAQGRNFKNPTWVTRRQEGKFPGHPYDKVGVATVGLPNLLLGRVGIAFATIWLAPASYQLQPEVSYETPQQAYEKALKQLDYYNRLADEDDRIRLIRNQRELRIVLDSWKDGRNFDEHKLGLVLLMEGADPIIDPRDAQEWYERGVRIIGPAWGATRYSAGTGEPGRLTSFGRELLEVMGDLNMILDLSHLAHEAYYEAVDLYAGSIIATHSNPSRFADIDRNLTDDMIRRLVERDGVMGVVLFNEFMKQGWKSGKSRKAEVTVTTVLDMIDHICQVAGSARHVGIGTDWDGGFGWESMPEPFDNHIDLWDMNQHLQSRQFEAESVQQILSGNFLRVLERGLPE